MNEKCQDSIVFEQSSKASETKIAYISPKVESVAISIQNVILQGSGGTGSGTVDPMNPEQP